MTTGKDRSFGFDGHVAADFLRKPLTGRLSHCRVDAGGGEAEWVEAFVATPDQPTLVYFFGGEHGGEALERCRALGGRGRRKRRCPGSRGGLPASTRPSWTEPASSRRWKAGAFRSRVADYGWRQPRHERFRSTLGSVAGERQNPSGSLPTQLRRRPEPGWSRVPVGLGGRRVPASDGLNEGRALVRRPLHQILTDGRSVRDFRSFPPPLGLTTMTAGTSQAAKTGGGGMEIIVVGVDGSDCSHDALRWAVDEGRRRSWPVEAAFAWTFPYAVPVLGNLSEPRRLERHSQEYLGALLRQELGDGCEMNVNGRVGSPGPSRGRPRRRPARCGFSQTRRLRRSHPGIGQAIVGSGPPYGRPVTGRPGYPLGRPVGK